MHSHAGAWERGEAQVSDMSSGLSEASSLAHTLLRGSVYRGLVFTAECAISQRRLGHRSEVCIPTREPGNEEKWHCCGNRLNTSVGENVAAIAEHDRRSGLGRGHTQIHAGCSRLRPTLPILISFVLNGSG